MSEPFESAEALKVFVVHQGHLPLGERDLFHFSFPALARAASSRGRLSSQGP